MMYHFGLVMDQQVGLRTQALNWERAVSDDPTVAPTWVPVRYETSFPIPLPGLLRNLAGTLAGVREIRRGLGGQTPLEAVLWATWAAKSVPELVASAPAFLVMDMTPLQMENMGRLYGYTRARARLFGGWKRRATDRLYRQASHFFPWNTWVAESLMNDYGVPAAKITPLSPGTDTSLFRPDPAAKANDGLVRLLFVGGDFQRKGGDLLLRWARETPQTLPWELHVVTRDTVPDVPGVHVHQNVSNNSPELIRLYQQSDLFVLPTRADCYSLVALEAMSCGLPVIISKLGGIPDLVSEGETGHLIAPDDYPAFAGAINALLADTPRRRAMGEAARARAVAQFDCRMAYRQILQAMKDAAPSPKPRAKVGAA